MKKQTTKKPSRQESVRIANLMSLQGRAALVTGGAGHIGNAFCETLAELGARVAVVDIRANAAVGVARRLQDEFGVPALGVGVDLADEAAVRALPGLVAREWGRLDVLVNCAAYVGTSALQGWAVPFEQQSTDAWRKAVEVNLTAVFSLTQAAVPLLTRSGHGSVVNVASTYAIVGPDMRLYSGTTMGNPAAYATSKGGVLQFTRWLATVLAPHVRVNAITPGGVQRGQQESFVAAYISRTPMRRMAREDDLKGALAYLASDLSSYVTGQNIVVDGGWTVW